MLNASIARRAWSAASRLPALSTCSSAHTRYCKAASTSGSRCLANKRSLILHTRQGIAGSKRKENGPFLITDNRCWHRSFAGKSFSGECTASMRSRILVNAGSRWRATQKPHSAYAFLARWKCEPMATKSTSRHWFPWRYSARPLHRRYSRFIRQRFSLGK